jgi:pimeloyl-ACP methyl ester carboxylesterase
MPADAKAETETDAITPFTLAVPEAALEDLRRRLEQTRWPDRETVGDWTQGSPLAKVQALCDYWRDGYDWRACEARLNALGQYKTRIDGLDIHFLHVRSPHPDALPLIITHGWPGSVIEFMKVIGPLTDPTAHGGRAEDAFHLVAPSLPGYGFSDKPTTTGWGVPRIAAAWITLMGRLGYDRWVAQGGDWGSAVTTTIGVIRPPGCAAIHVNMPLAFPGPEARENLTEQEKTYLAGLAYYQEKDSGYSKQQATRPQSVGYGLVDSPAGQAAWIYEKLWAWTDNQGAPEDALTWDEMLDDIMLYWLPAAGASSARLYWESFGSFGAIPLELPVGVSIYPKEIFRISRRWADKVMSNIIHWGELDRGGHFAAWEQPDLYVGEIRTCFAKVR